MEKRAAHVWRKPATSAIVQQTPRRMCGFRSRSSSGMRAERLSGRELDTVGNGGLHAIEEKEAAEEDESDDGGRSQKDEAGRLAAAGNGPAETVNDAGHGVEAVKPAPARRNKRGRISDGRGEHPELHEERNHIADVAIESIERGEPQAAAES